MGEIHEPGKHGDPTNGQLADQIDEVNLKVDRLVRLMEGEPPDIERGVMIRIIKIEAYVMSRVAVERFLAASLGLSIIAGIVAASVWLIRKMGT